MNDLFRRKLENIHSSLLSCHRDTQYYSPSIIGDEREGIKKELLSLVLPPGYRIGAGTIVDVEGNETGQIDAVIEQPFSLSFPVAKAENRLYMADTVGAAFEIKSNLNTKGEKARLKMQEIRRLNRYKAELGKIVNFDFLHIPCFIMAYVGLKNFETIEKNFIKPREVLSPNGVLVIESELFYGRTAGGQWYKACGKAGCILAFLSCVIGSLSFTAQNDIDLHRYSKLLKPNV